MVEEGIGGADRRMVDVDPPFRFRPDRPGHHAGAEVDLAGGIGDPRRDREGAAALHRDLVEPRAADAAAGREQRHRLEEVGLAGAVLAGEHHRQAGERQGQRGVVPVAGELQRRDGSTPLSRGGGPGDDGLRFAQHGHL